MPDQLDLPDLFHRCQRKEEAACGAIYAWVSRMADRILGRDFSNLSPVERDEAADRARYRIVEAMTLGRIEAVHAKNNWPIIAYVKQVIENAAKDVSRQRHGTDGAEELETYAATGPGPDRQASLRAALACIEQILNSIEPADRFIFILKCNGVATRTIAADIHRLYQVVVTTQAVDTRFSRLRAKIQRECEGQ